MVILPTHTCFDDVLDFQCELMKVDPERAHRQFIVHGILLAPEGPKMDEPYAHAWVEDDEEGRVYQSGFLDGQKIWWGCDRDEWKQVMRVQDESRYTFLQALALNWQTNHYGPWVETYRELCGGRTVHADVQSIARSADGAEV